MNDGCNGCKYEDTPCIIRICGNAPRATADDIKSFGKCVLLNRANQKKGGKHDGRNDRGAIPRSNKGK